jgi:hypothetical protein
MDIHTGPDSAAKNELPSKEECWNDFWALMVPQLARLHAEGKLPSHEERLAAQKPQALRQESSAKDVRDWLRAHGRPVGRAGRLPQRLLDEYERAIANQILLKDD